MITRIKSAKKKIFKKNRVEFRLIHPSARWYRSGIPFRYSDTNWYIPEVKHVWTSHRKVWYRSVEFAAYHLYITTDPIVGHPFRLFKRPMMAFLKGNRIFFVNKTWKVLWIEWHQSFNIPESNFLGIGSPFFWGALIKMSSTKPFTEPETEDQRVLRTCRLCVPFLVRTRRVS